MAGYFPDSPRIGPCGGGGTSHKHLPDPEWLPRQSCLNTVSGMRRLREEQCALDSHRCISVTVQN